MFLGERGTEGDLWASPGVAESLCVSRPMEVISM